MAQGTLAYRFSYRMRVTRENPYYRKEAVGVEILRHGFFLSMDHFRRFIALWNGELLAYYETLDDVVGNGSSRLQLVPAGEWVHYPGGGWTA